MECPLSIGRVAKHFRILIIQKQTCQTHHAPHPPAPTPFQPPHPGLA